MLGRPDFFIIGDFTMDYKKLSKEISYALRHNPQKFGITLDNQGYTETAGLLAAINNKNKYEREITVDDICHIIKTSDKQRFEINGDKIRALYGHSIPMHIEKIPAAPPEILYHGTTKDALNKILKTGLLPMERQYVHLSADTEMAVMVGKRRDPEPAILKIDAAAAYGDGIVFFIGNDNVWLCDKLPAKYITI